MNTHGGLLQTGDRGNPGVQVSKGEVSPARLQILPPNSPLPCRAFGLGNTL